MIIFHDPLRHGPRRRSLGALTERGQLQLVRVIKIPVFARRIEGQMRAQEPDCEKEGLVLSFSRLKEIHGHRSRVPVLHLVIGEITVIPGFGAGPIMRVIELLALRPCFLDQTVAQGILLGPQTGTVGNCNGWLHDSGSSSLPNIDSS